MSETLIIEITFGILLSIGSFVLFILAFKLFYKYIIQEKRCTSKVKGIIKKYTLATRGGENSGIHLPVVHYIVNGKEYTIQKNPKTDRNNLKKSHKGLCYVAKRDGNFVCHDGYTSESIPDGSLLTTVFKDGVLVREDSFVEIRKRLNG